jgi:hypothetical protein
MVTMGSGNDVGKAIRARVRRTCEDLARLQVLLADGAADDGFAIALTNDPSFWQGGNREDVADAAFRLGEGRALAGALAWAAHTGAGTMRA